MKTNFIFFIINHNITVPPHPVFETDRAFQKEERPTVVKPEGFLKDTANC